MAIPKPRNGRLTFDAEGHEGGRFHSRQFHVPSSGSGLTIGRGYDMKSRSKSEVRDDLTAAGLDPATAALISQAAGKRGDDAEEFIEENNLESFQISPKVQLELFKIEYGRQEADAKRLATKPDVVKKYGKTNWSRLNPAIRTVVVDLRFRGDYTPSARRFLQASIAKNDLDDFRNAIGNRDLWPNVPEDRFDRRKAFIDKA